MKDSGCCQSGEYLTNTEADSEEACILRCEEGQCFENQNRCEKLGLEKAKCNYYSWNAQTKRCITSESCNGLSTDSILCGDDADLFVTSSNIACKLRNFLLLIHENLKENNTFCRTRKNFIGAV